MAEKLTTEHVEQLTASEYHKEKKACIVRHHSAKGEHCDYQWNGYNATQGRAVYYNAPRYDPAKVQRQGGDIIPDIWDVDKEPNFIPRAHGGNGASYPYKHAWHHLIPNAMLFGELYAEDRDNHYQLLELLMSGGYNLNSGRNIVLLPAKEGVGKLIRWVIHPNNHPKYDKFAKDKLNWLRGELEAALVDKEIHDVDPEKTAKLKEDVEKVSDSLFYILERLPSGQHVNVINELGERIEGRLRKIKEIKEIKALGK
ncbi:AHH domain-containing protein [Cystobacter fuscus]|uniref:AHH domain-containing protein n=1 Tax=Cystobacter fuscus TaxID=43 RepID=UPI0037BE6EF8